MRLLNHVLAIASAAAGYAAGSRLMAHAASASTPREGSGKDFDGMLGTWTFDAHSKNTNSPPRFSGHWTWQRSGNGTLVEDDYHVVNDSGKVVTWQGRSYEPGETIYLGVTYRAFDVNTKRWTTAFIQPPATQWSLGTAWRDGDSIREAPMGQQSNRARFYDVGPNHFSWRFDISKDGGKTWITDFVRVEATRVGMSDAK